MERWEILDSHREIVDPPWLTVRRDTIRRPNGAVHGYWIVEQLPWVQILAITPDEQVIFVRQYRHAAQMLSLELPGGYADRDEPLEAAVRELREETGYGGGEWQPYLTLAPNPALMNNQLHVFLARGVKRVSEPDPDEGEDLAIELHGVDQLADLVDSGRVSHALHVPALLKFALDSRADEH